MSNSYPPFVDIHCHPSIKPYGKSFENNINSSKRRKKTSIWYRERPSFVARGFNRLSTVTRFTQTDFTTLAKGNVKLICASLSPIEKGFFISKIGKNGKGLLTDTVAQIITNIGFKKINFIQENKDYFAELENEMDFYCQLNGHEIKLGRKKWKYVLTKNNSEVRQNIKSHKRIISVIPTIEGFHALNNDNTTAPDATVLSTNITKVKSWQFAPLFISPAHHFNNYLCGHAFSIGKKMQELIDQSEGANLGITDLGKVAIGQCLDNTSYKRILIDIKHMSRRSRREYYQMLDTGNYGMVPIIASHAAVNGYPSVNTDDNLNPDNGLFNGDDINIFDDEIIRIGMSEGLFGIQLDERRIASTEEKKNTRSLFYRKGIKKRAKMVWNQIEHIAVTLDKQNLPAWNCQVIGSDFDGMVDPIDGFWTAREYKRLYGNLLFHANTFVENYNFQLSCNRMEAMEIMNKVFSNNLFDFLEKWYK